MTNKRKNLKELYDGECVRVWSSNCSLIEQKNTSILRKIGHRISAAFVPEAKTSEDYYHFQVIPARSCRGILTLHKVC